MKIHIFKYSVGLAIFFLSAIGLAQEKKGNIVEYFGKEKVEEIREGKVIHVFKEGLILKLRRYGINSSSTPKNPVFSRFLLEDNLDIKDGGAFIDDENPVTWERIEVGETNEFKDNALRSGYLYLEYNAEKAVNVIFEASGHTTILINGFPHEGDHYDFGYSLIPLRLEKGKNTFVLQGGRFPRIRARILDPYVSIAFTKRDMTMPDLLKEETDNLVGGIRVMNVNQSWFKGGSITCKINGNAATTEMPFISPMNVRKVPFQIPVPPVLDDKKVTYTLELKDRRGKLLHTEELTLNVKSKYEHHKQTFISNIDGSVQYYSIAPSSNKNLENPAMFFSVHGASVEAVNQARAYKKKDWGHLVAPTNRRPFGFAWEDWGRLDALEVFDHAQNLLKTDPQRTYLTGHSMGGHGTWYLGATYPDRWGAIAPCAGYPDLLGYRDSFVRRLKTMTDDELKRFGMTRHQAEKMLSSNKLTEPSDILLDSIMRRAGNPSRTLKLKRNYLHYGVYILHGEVDTVVPTFIAREMRANLGSFHNDFTYYEYPNGSHWYGDHSVDWPPIFDFFKFRSIKASDEIDRIEFYTASPGISSKSHFIEIHQQEIPFEISSFNFRRDSISAITTSNVATFNVDLHKMGNKSGSLMVDGQEIQVDDNSSSMTLSKSDNSWKISEKPSASKKGPHRNGGFKDAFRNNMVLVFASKGSKTENEWYYHRALFDAEKFYYRGNGNVELVKDTDFSPEKYPDQNVILYGNSSNNAAWKDLLNACPMQVSDGILTLGTKTKEGPQWGAYFIYPRPDSQTASVGVISATGAEGMKASFANHYLVNGTTFPDVTIVKSSVIKNGISGVECAGFFGNDWSVETGDFVWRE
ncbi:MAG: alpha/beta hydrolase [Cytophagales bacterium]|nr:alpha/beta hydrolase [Cytophagales bacterium]